MTDFNKHTLASNGGRGLKPAAALEPVQNLFLW